MFERPRSGEAAILVHIDFPSQDTREYLDEFRELALSAGATTEAEITGTRPAPDAKYFVGSGKAEEIKQAVNLHQAELVIFNHALSPAQERNLERLFQCRVLDRTGLILDIFAQRARTFEGKLQVELAQLRHMSTRLVRGWTHLERQKGGIGLRGPGEKQLESDRRLLRRRITTIESRLEKVRKQRDQGRQARRRIEMPTVSLVGYTNAGKSTLFNRLTESDVLVADQLFATLDPTLRRIQIPQFGSAIVADTVGFIRHLPHQLVEAFRATLEETKQASLLLHVVDAHDAARQANIQEVDDVLAQIGAEAVPQLQVYNKIDLMEGIEPRVERNKEGRVRRVWCSALTGAGIDLLYESLAELLAGNIVHKTICLPPEAGQQRAYLYDHGFMIDERVDDEGNHFISVRMPWSDYQRLKK